MNIKNLKKINKNRIDNLLEVTMLQVYRLDK